MNLTISHILGMAIALIFISFARGANTPDNSAASKKYSNTTVNNVTAVPDPEPVKKDKAIQAMFSNVFSPPSRGRSPPMPLDPAMTACINEIAQDIGKDDVFHDLRPSHMEAFNKLVNHFRGISDTTGLLNLAQSIQNHPNLNYKLWLKAFVSVSMEREELLGLDMPNPLQLIPGCFVHSEAFNEAKRGRATGRNCVIMDGRYTSDNDKEDHQIWYFREDLFNNIRHWNWHNAFPLQANLERDRRGESFSYFHQNILARYQAERLCHGIPRATPFILSNEATVKDGYNSHLQQMGARNGIFGPRTPYTKLSPSARFLVDIQRVIQDDIHNQAFIRTDGSRVITTNLGSMDILGDLLEGSSQWSINPRRYYPWGLHNQGHVEIANLSKFAAGVMSATEAALRDPIFYRWHLMVAGIIDRIKDQLMPYAPYQSDFPLSWPMVSLQNVFVISETEDGEYPMNPFDLQTFFRNATITLTSPATDSANNAPVKYCIHTLDHRPFRYEVELISYQRGWSRATIRIFMAPRFDENGQRFRIDDQRKLFFPMDEFVVFLSEGYNRVYRHSYESALTIPSPFDGWYSDVRHCECGWPSHLLLPRGRPEGMQFDLFVMVTDGAKDLPRGYVQNPRPPCHSSHIVCGRPGEQYPDARPMGYPFDRKTFSTWSYGKQLTVGSLDDYVNSSPNMMYTTVNIIHSEVTV